MVDVVAGAHRRYPGCSIPAALGCRCAHRRAAPFKARQSWALVALYAALVASALAPPGGPDKKGSSDGAIADTYVWAEAGPTTLTTDDRGVVGVANAIDRRR
jgi:hypothetical protein